MSTHFFFALIGIPALDQMGFISSRNTEEHISRVGNKSFFFVEYEIVFLTLHLSMEVSFQEQDCKYYYIQE
jgi:hypothetical protein